MKLSIKELYELSKSKNLPVLGKDGLPICNVVTGDEFFMMASNTTNLDHIFDFSLFYEICIPSICRGDMIAGDCEIMEIDGNKFIGVDLFVKSDDTLNFELIKVEYCD